MQEKPEGDVVVHAWRFRVDEIAFLDAQVEAQAGSDRSLNGRAGWQEGDQLFPNAL